MQTAQESNKSIKWNLATSVIAVLAYCLIGLLVWEIFTIIGVEPTDKEGLIGVLDKIGKGFELIFRFVSIMVLIAIGLVFISWALNFKNLRNGFIFCALITLLLFFFH